MTETHRTSDPPELGSGRYEEALCYLYERINYERMVGASSGYPFRLQRMNELLGRLGLTGYLYTHTPRPKVPLVHIAGTKGKGSTAAMVAAALSAAGLKTGLYTSPHLHDLEERFRIDGRPCQRQELVALVEQMRPIAEHLAEDSIGSPSFFELTTAIALLHFDTSGCDAIVLEVGLGGRLDSTNVCASSVTAITSIGLDHQHVLGHTREKIAAEKAGIIKPGIPVVSGVNDAGPRQVIEQIAVDQQAPCYRVGRDFEYHWQPAPDWGCEIRFRGIAEPLGGELQVKLLMEGEHQGRNAANAIAILRLARDQGVAVDDAAIIGGLGQLRCDGRTERYLLGENVWGIVDAAHNEDSIAALVACLLRRSSDRRISVVFGTSLDKSAEPMLSLLAEVADDLFLTRFVGNPRSRPPTELCPLVPASLAAATSIIPDPIEACDAALRKVSPGGTLVVCGSFFLAAETRAWMASKTVDHGAREGPPGAMDV